MGRSFYNAKQDKTGCGCGFSFNTKDQSIYVSFVRQSDWNAAKKTGSFNGDKVNLKFSPSEAGHLIYSIERMEAWKGFHDTSKGNYADKYTTAIQFGPFGDKGAERFGFSVKKTDKETKEETKWSIAFSKGDAIVIREYLKFAMEHLNLQMYSDDKKKRDQKQATNVQQGDKPAPAEEEAF